MHLADRRSCKRLLLKVLQVVPPVWAEVTADRFLQRQQNQNYFCRNLCFSLQLFCSSQLMFTIICLVGMKSALCRTRSKILANWGLIKASSEGRTENSSVNELIREVRTTSVVRCPSHSLIRHINNLRAKSEACTRLLFNTSWIL